MFIPEFYPYTSSGINSLAFKMFPKITLYYSYETVIGLRVGGVLITRENIWGATTGRHLNFLDGGDKASRLPAEEFKNRLQAVLSLEHLKRVLQSDV